MGRPALAALASLLVAWPLRAQAPSDVEVPLDRSLAYRALQAEIQALDRDIATRSFGYFGQAERDALKKDLAHLRAIQKRVDAYAFALPPNCDEYQPLATGQRPSANVIQVGPDERHVLLSPERGRFGEKAINAYTPRDVRCRPRMAIADSLVLKVREAADLRRTLAERRFGFEQLDEKREAEHRLVDLEAELQRAGMPGDVYAAPPRPEQIDAQVLGGQPVAR
jgi:hypothetical protein